MFSRGFPSLRYDLATLMLIAARLDIMKLPQRRMGNSGSSTPPPPPGDIESNAALELHLLHFVRARLQLSFPQCPRTPCVSCPPPFLSPPASQTSAKHHTVILSPPYRLKTIGSSLTALLTVRGVWLPRSSFFRFGQTLYARSTNQGKMGIRFL